MNLLFSLLDPCMGPCFIVGAIHLLGPCCSLDGDRHAKPGVTDAT